MLEDIDWVSWVLKLSQQRLSANYRFAAKILDNAGIRYHKGGWATSPPLSTDPNMIYDPFLIMFIVTLATFCGLIYPPTFLPQRRHTRSQWCESGCWQSSCGTLALISLRGRDLPASTLAGFGLFSHTNRRNSRRVWGGEISQTRC